MTFLSVARLGQQPSLSPSSLQEGVSGGGGEMILRGHGEEEKGPILRVV